MSIRDLIPESWNSELKEEFKKPYFTELNSKVQNSYATDIIFPKYTNIFKTFDLDLKDIKVVIIGQDCYQNPGFATGLAFSVPQSQTIPQSLQNIYKELNSDISEFKIPVHGDLSGWLKEGVFLLNTTLTVKLYESNSHKDYGWETFTDAVIDLINAKCNNVVFILWGNDAKRKGSKIDTSKHLVLTGAHPSPYSADKGFFGGKYFSKCNQYLIQNNKTAVNWQV